MPDNYSITKTFIYDWENEISLIKPPQYKKEKAPPLEINIEAKQVTNEIPINSIEEFRKARESGYEINYDKLSPWKEVIKGTIYPFDTLTDANVKQYLNKNLRYNPDKYMIVGMWILNTKNVIRAISFPSMDEWETVKEVYKVEKIISKCNIPVEKGQTIL